jgi:fatty acid desaturase
MYNQASYIKLTKPFMARNMLQYWVDFLCTWSLFVMGMVAWIFAPMALSIVGLVIGIFAAYRCGSFMHEIVHFNRRSKEEMAFKAGWNLLFGIIILSPSRLYDAHLEHHMPKSFATIEDPEYVPITNRSFFGLAFFVFHHVLGPITLVAVRMFLNPIIWIFPALGAKLMNGKGTSLVINWDYIPTDKTKATAFDRFAIVASTALLYVYLGAIISGLVPLVIVAKILALIIISMVLNGVRTLVAHRYINYDRQSVSREEQLLDSVNLIGNPIIGGLLAPVGLRYHALHHLVQALPYHSLEPAHIKLMAELPEDDSYHQVNISLSQAMRELKSGEKTEAGTVMAAS